ncbi:hypothetical protein ABL78_7546 [Leptomonas seymouri]|uniref:Uncharacterized protein n=1 Tax=Leptomonas seymouri TaxID=5684 RepID=A0A0N0P2W0_LEPSE|nr:hypothetical protein ABL78_7546 [Leptomonas seymouri]|eukprot:KPI83419.1 hypothetical protein ABL78_7546 [Leptomonas seymouri]
MPLALRALPSSQPDGEAEAAITADALHTSAAHHTLSEKAVRAGNLTHFESLPVFVDGAPSGASVLLSTVASHTQTAKHRAFSHLRAALFSSSASGERASSAGRLLRRMMCCTTRLRRCLRSFGFLKAEGNAHDLAQLLVCACTAVAVLLVLLLLAVGLLIVVFVVLVPGAQLQLQQTVKPSLDLNHPDMHTTNRSPAGKGGNQGDVSQLSYSDLHRVLEAAGLTQFLQQALDVEKLRRHLLRNEALLVSMRGMREKDGPAQGTDDLARLVQGRTELERLSGQLLQVAVYIGAVHAHDPRLGLVELSDFLLDVKGRGAALGRAAEQARRDAVTTAATSGSGGRVMPAETGGPSVGWTAELKTVLADHTQSARLRAQLPGFVGVPAGQEERWTRQPFDDVAMLQYRHAWARSEVLPRLGRAGSSGRAGAGAVSAHDVAKRAALKADLYDVASIFNHVHYYPLRRYTAMQAFSPATVADTDAWYSEVVAGVQARFGAAVSGGGASGAAESIAVRDSPLSLLSLPRLPTAREDEVTRLLTREDAAWMPAGLRAGAAVNRQTIFVSLASFRDMECAPTVLDLYRTARNPHRVYVGLALQNHVGDMPCLLPEMYGPFLCPSSGDVLDAHAAAREVAARRRSLRGDGADFTKRSDSDVALFDKRVCFLPDQIRVRDIDATHAKGPTYGRFMAMLLYRGEELAMVLDSHNRFRPLWDTLGVSLLQRFGEPKTALSYYPEAYNPTDAHFNAFRTTTAYLCKAFFLSNFGYLRLNAMVISSPAEFTQNNRYNDAFVAVQSNTIQQSQNFRLPQPWVAGGFLFTNATIFRDVPFDPHLDYIFDGEEVLYSVRLWTHGYNIYSPPLGLCFHIYGRTKAPKIWSESAAWYSLQSRSRPRIQFYLQSHSKGNPNLLEPANTTNAYVVVDSSRYGMGRQRTVSQWYDYAGADPVNYTLDGRWCGIDQVTQ